MIWTACRRCRVPASPLSAVHKESRHKMKAIKKLTRAEIESLIKSLLTWQKEHPDWTGRRYNGDRILKPAEWKSVKNMFNRALRIQSQIIDFAKSLSPDERLRFPNFVISPIAPDTTVANALDYVQILIETLCKFRRNTLHNTKSNQKPKTNTSPKYTAAVIAKIQQLLQADCRLGWKEIAALLNSEIKPKRCFTEAGLRRKWCDRNKNS